MLMEETTITAVTALANAAVPGVGPVLAVLNVIRHAYIHMNESKALCDSLQTRLDATWSRLLKMEATASLPPTFQLKEFIDILVRFHQLVLKQTNKPFVVRIGTSFTFMKQLQACHEELDQLNDQFRDQATDLLLQWRVEWERNVKIMQQEIAQIAAPGVAARMCSGSWTESNGALVTLVHEQQKLVDDDQLFRVLQAICNQLARAKNLTLPTSMPPWFFTFDDIDIETEPMHKTSPSTSMGLVHRAKWGTHTRVIVKKIELPVPPKPSAIVTWKEADVWWKLNHPNVVRMFGACHVTKPAFIVCEEASHGNIRDYLMADSLHRRRFWRLQLDVAIGLTHLKTNRVVHGNLKLNNILVGDDGRAKITDFGFSYIRSTDCLSDTVLTDDSFLDNVAPYAPSWPAPELRAAVESGERMTPSYASDIYAFGICIMQLLSGKDPKANQYALERLTLQPKRPPGVRDEIWDLIQRMCAQDPNKRLKIHQVQKRLQRLAEDEAVKDDDFSASMASSHASSLDVDARRNEYQQQHSALRTEDIQRNQSERELETLRQKIRSQEQKLERLIAEKQRAAEAAPPLSTPATGPNPRSQLPPSTTTKQLLHFLRWGTPEVQTEALVAIDTLHEVHRADVIIENKGLDTIVACIKYGHSSEFRILAIDVLQSIVTAGRWKNLKTVLDHRVMQPLMGILHYRGVAIEQRRAGQLLVLLATKSTRARIFFEQEEGWNLLIEALWQSKLALFDRYFEERTGPEVTDEMRRFLAENAMLRVKDGDYAMVHLKNYELAMRKYTEAVTLDARNGRLFAKRSGLYTTMKQFEYAVLDAQKCIRLLPHYGEGYYRLAIALYYLKRTNQADRTIREGRRQDGAFFTEKRMYELVWHQEQSGGTETPNEDRTSYRRRRTRSYPEFQPGSVEL